MPKFTDSQGDDWDVTVDINALKRIKDLKDIDLGQPFQPPEDPVLYRICRDPLLAVDILYCVVKPQADERDMDSWEFGTALAGGAVRKGIDALMKGLVNFFQNLGRKDAASAAPKLQKLFATFVTEGEKKAKQIDPEEMVKEMLESMEGDLSAET